MIHNYYAIVYINNHEYGPFYGLYYVIILHLYKTLELNSNIEIASACNIFEYNVLLLFLYSCKFKDFKIFF